MIIIQATRRPQHIISILRTIGKVYQGLFPKKEAS